MDVITFRRFEELVPHKYKLGRTILYIKLNVSYISVIAGDMMRLREELSQEVCYFKCI